MKKYIITINEVDEEGIEIPRYQQTVDQIDIHAVINAVNNVNITKQQRQRALRSDAGKPRKNPDVTSQLLRSPAAPGKLDHLV